MVRRSVHTVANWKTGCAFERVESDDLDDGKFKVLRRYLLEAKCTNKPSARRAEEMIHMPPPPHVQPLPCLPPPPPPHRGGTVTWPMNNKKSIGNHRR